MRRSYKRQAAFVLRSLARTTSRSSPLSYANPLRRGFGRAQRNTTMRRLLQCDACKITRLRGRGRACQEHLRFLSFLLVFVLTSTALQQVQGSNEYLSSSCTGGTSQANFAALVVNGSRCGGSGQLLTSAFAAETIAAVRASRNRRETTLDYSVIPNLIAFDGGATGDAPLSPGDGFIVRFGSEAVFTAVSNAVSEGREREGWGSGWAVLRAVRLDVCPHFSHVPCIEYVYRDV